MGTLILIKFIQDLKNVYGSDKTLKEIQREIEDIYYGTKNNNKYLEAYKKGNNDGLHNYTDFELIKRLDK